MLRVAAALLLSVLFPACGAELDEQLKSLSLTIEKNPTDVEALARRAGLYARAHDHAKAAADLSAEVACVRCAIVRRSHSR